jgi:hypothetical protein
MADPLKDDNLFLRASLQLERITDLNVKGFIDEPKHQSSVNMMAEYHVLHPH